MKKSYHSTVVPTALASPTFPLREILNISVPWFQRATYCVGNSIPTDEGWLYLAAVLDVGSRRVLGYAMASHLRTDLVADCLDTAVATRGGDIAGVIFHSDRGCQTGFTPVVATP